MKSWQQLANFAPSILPHNPEWSLLEILTHYCAGKTGSREDGEKVAKAYIDALYIYLEE